MAMLSYVAPIIHINVGWFFLHCSAPPSFDPYRPLDLASATSAGSERPLVRRVLLTAIVVSHDRDLHLHVAPAASGTVISHVSPDVAPSANMGTYASPAQREVLPLLGDSRGVMWAGLSGWSLVVLYVGATATFNQVGF